MLFKPELIEKILKGEKTQTRRIKKPGEKLVIARDGTKFVAHLKGSGLSLTNSRLKWQTGKTYAICPGRGKPGVAQIRLLDIREEPLQDGKWGWGHYEGYKEGVKPIHPGISHIPDEKGVFHLQDKLLFFRLWDSINNKPGQRSEDNPVVFVLTFELVKEGELERTF